MEMTFEEEYINYIILRKGYKHGTNPETQKELNELLQTNELKQSYDFYWFIHNKLVIDFSLKNKSITQLEIDKIANSAAETYDIKRNKFDDSVFQILVNYVI